MQIATKPDRQTFPLSMASEGEHVKIVMHHGGKRMHKRLSSLGLSLNSVIQVLQREGNSLVIGRTESRLALGMPVAHKIMVVGA